MQMLQECAYENRANLFPEYLPKPIPFTDTFIVFLNMSQKKNYACDFYTDIRKRKELQFANNAFALKNTGKYEESQNDWITAFIILFVIFNILQGVMDSETNMISFLF